MGQESFITKFLTTFKSIDMYGTGSQIGIRGAIKSNSVLGSIITLAALFASIYLTSETIGDMFNQTNPTISKDIVFDIHKLQINSTSLNISLAFFKPLRMTTNLTISDADNNYTYVQMFNNLNYTCYNCTGIKKKSVVITDLTPCPPAIPPPLCTNDKIFQTLNIDESFNYLNYPNSSYNVDIQEKSLLVNSSNTQKTYQNISITTFSKKDSNNILSLFKNRYKF